MALDRQYESGFEELSAERDQGRPTWGVEEGWWSALVGRCVGILEGVAIAKGGIGISLGPLSFRVMHPEKRKFHANCGKDGPVAEDSLRFDDMHSKRAGVGGDFREKEGYCLDLLTRGGGVLIRGMVVKAKKRGGHK